MKPSNGRDQFPAFANEAMLFETLEKWILEYKEKQERESVADDDPGTACNDGNSHDPDR